jgi:uncharacterized protein YnzC (UPF0291/DUF896 family)
VTHNVDTEVNTVDIRIGVTQATREIALEVEDDAKVREALKASVESAVKGEIDTLWITDKKGRDIAIPSAKIAYVEIGSSDADRRIGFGG